MIVSSLLRLWTYYFNFACDKMGYQAAQQSAVLASASLVLGEVPAGAQNVTLELLQH